MEAKPHLGQTMQEEQIRTALAWFRPANISVINRRENYPDHDWRCLLGQTERRNSCS